jgi:hypothetical protein
MVARPRRDGRTAGVSQADSPPRAVLDVDIIYSRVLHDLMGRVAWVDYIPQNFPAGCIELDGASAAIDFSSLTADPDDFHVCASAIVSGADYLFTHDQGYLPEGLSHHGVHVFTPDEFLASAFDSHVRGILDLLEQQASTWAGGRPVEELFAAIERAGAPSLVGKARRSLSL